MFPKQETLREKTTIPLQYKKRKAAPPWKECYYTNHAGGQGIPRQGPSPTDTHSPALHLAAGFLLLSRRHLLCLHIQFRNSFKFILYWSYSSLVLSGAQNIMQVCVFQEHDTKLYLWINVFCLITCNMLAFISSNVFLFSYVTLHTF